MSVDRSASTRSSLGTSEPSVPKGVALWPQRVRCYRCRSYYDFIVVDRLYCSWECAGRDPDPERTRWQFGPQINGYGYRPPGQPDRSVPRQCARHDKRVWKIRYTSKSEAKRCKTMHPNSASSEMVVYQCDHCGYFHLGNPPKKP